MNETKICPYCGEEILSAAKKCKFCGEFLDEELSDKTLSKKEILEIRKKIEELRTKDIKGNYGKEVSDAINICEEKFTSICSPGYIPFSYTLGIIYFIIIICSLCYGFTGFIFGILVSLGMYLYFLPSYIAFRNGHKQAWLILVINVFFSCLFIPYFIILFWALSNKHNEDVLTKAQSDRIRTEILPIYKKICNSMENKNTNSNKEEN